MAARIGPGDGDPIGGEAPLRDEFDVDDIDDEDLFGSEIGDEDNDVDEKELFGDDTEDEAPPRPPGAVEQQIAEVTGLDDEPREAPGTPSASEAFSEMDEREIFGDITSEEEQEEVDRSADVVLMRRPAPTGDRPMVALRLPNILSVEPHAYNPATVQAWMTEGHWEGKSTQEREVLKLFNEVNCIRWRFKKGPNGETMTDEDGRPQYESNCQMVEWEDGSWTVHVGSEVFSSRSATANISLYEMNQPDAMVCHGTIRSQANVTPISLESVSHENLKKAQFRKHEPIRRTLLTTAEEQADARQMFELQEEQNKRLEKSKRKAAAIEQDKDKGMTAAFLEDEADGGQGPSIMDLKQDAKRSRE